MRQKSCGQSGMAIVLVDKAAPVRMQGVDVTCEKAVACDSTVATWPINAPTRKGRLGRLLRTLPCWLHELASKVRIAMRYSRTIAYACVLLVPQPLGACGRWELDGIRSGRDGQLCGTLHARLNKAVRSGECMYDAIETYPGFSQPPWQKLVPIEHLDLVAQFERFAQEGGGPAQQSDDYYRSRAQSFINEGGELAVWRVHLLFCYDDACTRRADGEQTVVMQTTKIELEHPPIGCPGKTSQGWVRRTFIVSADLTQLDPQVEPSVAHLYTNRALVLFDGMPLLINSYSVAHPSYVICNFMFTDMAGTTRKQEVK